MRNYWRVQVSYSVKDVPTWRRNGKYGVVAHTIQEAITAAIECVPSDATDVVCWDARKLGGVDAYQS